MKNQELHNVATLNQNTEVAITLANDGINMASLFGAVEVLTKLIDKNAISTLEWLLQNKKINIETDCSTPEEAETPLLMYALNKNKPEVAILLINNGAKIEYFLDEAEDIPFDAIQPIGLAAQKGYIEVIKKLVERGADVNAPSGSLYNFYTPLQLAEKTGDINSKTYLLETGAHSSVTFNEEEDENMSEIYNSGEAEGNSSGALNDTLSVDNSTMNLRGENTEYHDAK